MLFIFSHEIKKSQKVISEYSFIELLTSAAHSTAGIGLVGRQTRRIGGGISSKGSIRVITH